MKSISFNPKQLETAEMLALAAAADVSTTLRENFGKTAYTSKSTESDWVTKWDGWAEERIAANVTRFAGGIGILGEETGASGEDSVYWTIDAIDGTGSFVRGVDTCTTMISLVDHGVPVLGVIHDFIRGDVYSARVCNGAYKNQTQSIAVSGRGMDIARIETYVDLDSQNGQKLQSSIRKTGAFILSTASAGHTFTSIAQGYNEGFVSHNNPSAAIWDYAPGALLVHEAGGSVMNLGSTDYCVDDPNFIATNREISGQLKAICKEVR